MAPAVVAAAPSGPVAPAAPTEPVVDALPSRGVPVMHAIMPELQRIDDEMKAHVQALARRVPHLPGEPWTGANSSYEEAKRTVPQAFEPKAVEPRKIGLGAPCTECSSTNTRVRDTKGPSRYPAFVRERVRYHDCADCGASFQSGPKSN